MDKQFFIEDSLTSLIDAVNKLENFVSKVNNEPKPSSDKDTAKERMLLLAEPLDGLPELINTQSKRIVEALAKLSPLFY